MNANIVTWGTIGLVIIAFVTWRTTRSTGRAAVKIAETQRDWDIMVDTVATVRTELHEAKAEASHLRKTLEEVNEVANVALANVHILSEHVRDHDLPMPRLRKVRINGT